MAHALVLDGMSIVDRESVDVQIERLGHEIRATTDEDYKRATWGLRPEDLAEIAAITGEAPRWTP